MSLNENLSFLPFVRASLSSWVKNWIWSYPENLGRSNLWLITHILTYFLSVASISFSKRKPSQFLSLKTSRQSVPFPCSYHESPYFNCWITVNYWGRTRIMVLGVRSTLLYHPTHMSIWIFGVKYNINISFIRR